MPVSVSLSVAWRDTAGRFARPPVAGAIDEQFPGLARDLVQRLQAATPIRTGNMQRGWRQSYLPSQKQIRITDVMPYWTYVAFGTPGGRQAANPGLQRVLRDAPGALQVTSDAIGRQILTSLKGS